MSISRQLRCNGGQFDFDDYLKEKIKYFKIISVCKEMFTVNFVTVV